MQNYYFKDALFEYDNKKYYFDDILDSLVSIGIKKNDTIIVHSDIMKFGKYLNFNEPRLITDVYIDAFLNVIGTNGTLIMPTYSYSFCNGEIFDPIKTPSHVGALTNAIIQKERSFRSIHPIFSVCAIGKNAKQITEGLSKNSFGIGSIFDRLQKIDSSKYVMFGVPYFACTHIHYIERIVGVNYRYVKKFKGKIRLNNKIYEDSYEFYVRYLNKNINPTFDKIENHLKYKNLLKKV